MHNCLVNIVILLLALCVKRSKLNPEQKAHTNDAEVIKVFDQYDSRAGFQRRLLTIVPAKSEQCFFIESLQANAHFLNLHFNVRWPPLEHYTNVGIILTKFIAGAEHWKCGPRIGHFHAD